MSWFLLQRELLGTVKVRELAYYGHIMRKQELSVSFIHVIFAALCQ